jgi:hypothetical protein
MKNAPTRKSTLPIIEHMTIAGMTPSPSRSLLLELNVVVAVDDLKLFKVVTLADFSGSVVID